MKDKGSVWKDMVTRNHLLENSIDELVGSRPGWVPDMAATLPVSVISDMTKSREMGFKEYISTEKSFFNLFDFLWQNKYIPKPKNCRE